MSKMQEGQEGPFEFKVHYSILKFLATYLPGSDVPPPLRLANLNEVEALPVRSVTLTKDEIDDLQSSLIGVFTRIGLGADDEPNAMGIYVEGIIDSFSPEW